jgi:hypothetical protein
LKTALAIREYGVPAVMGRPHLYAKEIRAFQIMLLVYDTYREYSPLPESDVQRWSKINPKRAEWWFALLQDIENANRTAEQSSN